MSEPARPAFMTKRTAWLTAAAIWTVLAITAWSFRDTLRASPAGVVAMGIIGLPPAIALYVVAEVVGEGVVHLLLWIPFKLVTLGRVRTELSEPDLTFDWHGFARNAQGQWVASQTAMALISLAMYAAAGTAWYLVA